MYQYVKEKLIICKHKPGHCQFTIGYLLTSLEAPMSEKCPQYEKSKKENSNVQA